MVDQALSVLLLDGVAHGLDVSELAVASLDLAQVRLEVEADVVLVPVGCRAGQALLPLEPRFNTTAPQEDEGADTKSGTVTGNFVG
ncbi:hypothetical protein ACI2LO_01035 [Streptomyces sp. NPDC033754]